MSTTDSVNELTPQMVIDAYEKHKARQRSRSAQATSNWPTALTHVCEAYAVYNRTVPADRRRHITTDLALIFSEGNDQERAVKRDLEAAGFEVSGEQEQMTWGAFEISGRRDLLLWKEGMRSKVRVEVKSCSPYTYQSINSVADLENSSKDWMGRWARQVALYMILENVDRYFLLLKSKSSGQIKIIEFKMNDHIWDAGEAMLKKAERVNQLVRIGGLPSKNQKVSDPDYCVECPFLDECLPELQLGPGARVLTDEDATELAKMAARREELETAYKEYKVLDDDIKEAVKAAASDGQNAVVFDDWIASIKESERKAYSVAAQTIKSVKIFRSKAG